MSFEQDKGMWPSPTFQTTDV